MERIFFLFVAILLTISCSHERQAKIEFGQKEVRFSLLKDSTFIAIFKFKNNGDDSLKILGADASCGCTALEFPKKAVPPGDSGMIRVIYDNSADHDTVIVKHIVVQTNTKPSLHTLTLLGNVK